MGIYGNYAPTPSVNVQVNGLAVIGEVMIRNDGDQVNGLGGAYTDRCESPTCSYVCWC